MQQCPSCAKTGGDTSHDNLRLMPDGKLKCFACGFFDKSGLIDEDTVISRPIKPILQDTGVYEALSNRGLTAKTMRDYKIFKTELYGKPALGLPFGDMQKVRLPGKEFITLGNTQTQSMFGEHLKSTAADSIVITEGEFDAASVYQALTDSRFFVTSLPNGAASAESFVKRFYKTLVRFKKIILCLDQDDAGRTAADTMLRLLPQDKTFVVELPMKDANEMVKAGQGYDLKWAVLKAANPKPSSIVRISDIMDAILTQPLPGLPYPWPTMTKATYGYQPGKILAIASAPGIGKSKIIEQIVEHFATQSIKTALFSFEQRPEETVQRFISNKIGKLVFEPGGYWDTEQIREEALKLDHHLYLYDNKQAVNITNIEDNIRYLSAVENVSFFVMDNLTAMSTNPLIDGKPVTQHHYIEFIVNKLCGLVKELNISILFVAHTNADNISKQVYLSSSPKNAEAYNSMTSTDMANVINKQGLSWESGRVPTMNHITGGTTLTKLADTVIVLSRNRISQDPLEKLITYAHFLKCGRVRTANDGIIMKLKYNTLTNVLEEMK